ncbi:MAG: cobalamin-binding protein [Gammaproteobacteria bacterium]|nr:cobalamin-binding protein [Gammaproteobacteria bacterium]
MNLKIIIKNIELFSILGLLLCAGALRAEIVVIDDLEREVRLPTVAKRVISLAPHLTEMLFSAGAGGQLVAIDSYSDFPQEARKLPRIGAYDAVDLERVFSLNPDLVVMWQSGNPAKLREKLLKLGVPVFVSQPMNYKMIASNVERLGRLTGHEQEARREASVFLSRMSAFENRPKRGERVFYQLSESPIYTINGDHLISEIIRLCGGENVFADLSILAPQVGLEAVITANPSVILINGTHANAQQWAENWQRWDTVSAVKKRRIHLLDADLLARHTFRIAEGATALCSALEQAH